MKEVFISYESSNQRAADHLVAALEDEGHHCWIATRKVPKGDPYDDHIPKAIAECSLVVMLFSKASLASPHVKKELRIAVKYGKKIIPFMLEDVELTAAFEYHIESNNRISADKNWNQAVEELLISLENEDPEPGTGKKRHAGTHSHSNYVCCPHCNCTVLKHKIGEVDRHLYPELNRTKKQKAYISCCNVARMFGSVFAALGTIVICFVFASLKSAAGFLASVAAVIIAIFYMYDLLGLNIRGKLVSAIKHSEVKYYTFRCADCEKEFGVLLPKDKPLEYCVEKLLEVTK